MTDKDKIMDRIAKLLRMSKDASSPEEAAIAAKRARVLMDQHQLHEGMIDLANSRFKEEMDKQKYGEWDPPKWFVKICVALATYNDCQAVYDAKKYVWFRGFKSDVAVCVSMARYLINRVYSISDKYIADIVASTGSKPSRNLCDAYRKGMMKNLCDRLYEMTEERNKSEEMVMSSGTSLVLIKSNQVTEHFGVANYVRTPNKIFGNHDSAYSRGYRDADQIGLNTQIEAGAKGKDSGAVKLQDKRQLVEFRDVVHNVWKFEVKDGDLRPVDQVGAIPAEVVEQMIKYLKTNKG
jgi:hypothetical protein